MPAETTKQKPLDDPQPLLAADRAYLIEQRRAFLIQIKAIEARLGIMPKCPHCNHSLDKREIR